MQRRQQKYSVALAQTDGKSLERRKKSAYFGRQVPLRKVLRISELHQVRFAGRRMFAAVAIAA